MSLCVYLEGPRTQVECICSTCGNAHGRSVVTEEFFHANITHNLGDMADAAGIYMAVWRPEEVGVEQAKQLAPLLRAAVTKMKEHPDLFRKLDSPNGWGTYKDFLPWLERYLAACEAHPDAFVRASR